MRENQERNAETVSSSEVHFQFKKEFKQGWKLQLMRQGSLMRRQTVSMASTRREEFLKQLTVF